MKRLLLSLALILASTTSAYAGSAVNNPPSTGGGGGAVSSVSSGGGCVTISPTTGAVVVTSTACAATSSVAPVGATYIVQTPDATLTNEQALSALSSGPMYVTTTTGVVTALTTLTGLTSTSSALTVNLSTGVSGGQTAFGGTLTTQNLTLQPNAADATTGHVYVGSSTRVDLDVANSRVRTQGGVAGGTVANYVNGPALDFETSGGNQHIGTSTAHSAGMYTNNVQRFGFGSTGLGAFGNTPFLYFTSANFGRSQANGEVMAFLQVPPTQATGASIAWNAYRWDATTTTVTGTTNVTTAAGFNFIDIEAQTITDSSAANFTNVSTMTIKGAVTMAGSATATNNYAFWIQGGMTRLDGGLTHTAGNVAFFNATPVGQQTVGANVNNVAASGTTGQFDDFTNGTVYATDYAALHATIYQLTRSVAQHTAALRNLGLGN